MTAIEIEENLNRIRVLTGKSKDEATKVIYDLIAWSATKTFSFDQALNMYLNDIRSHGKPNMTIEAFNINEQPK
jgi:PHP family Zn ribbon phosphoesterase